jgi:alkylresorcinol/alkylpyrone synthase
VRSVGTALPALRVTQREVLEFILARYPLRDATKALYRRVLANPSVQTRHFALDDLQEVLDTDHEKVRARFERRAVELSARSLKDALAAAGAAPRDLDALWVTTCTGSLCPGLSAYVVEAAGLRTDVHAADLAGMGCGAALPALREAWHFTRANPGALAAVVSTELSSCAMFSDDAADLVVSNALFADGSAAAVVGSGRGAPASAAPRLKDFASLLVPEWRDDLRFRTDGGRLRNVLSKDVPRQAGEALQKVTARLLAEHGLARRDVSHWVLHAGGEKVLDAAAAALELAPARLDASRRVLRDCGNMSSPTVLFVLKDLLAAESPRAGELGIMASFGAGFSAYAALLEF